jgi:hypothetical protein
MLFGANAVVISALLLTCVSASASSPRNGSAVVAALQVEAEQAQPRDSVFLYAELVSQMTDLAGQQLNAGDSVKASQTIALVRLYAEKMSRGIADDSKKIKGAELLIQRTSVHLEGILSEASYEDRPSLEATLKQLNHVQVQLMEEVLKK